MSAGLEREWTAGNTLLLIIGASWHSGCSLADSLQVAGALSCVHLNIKPERGLCCSIGDQWREREQLPFCY